MNPRTLDTTTKSDLSISKEEIETLDAYLGHIKASADKSIEAYDIKHIKSSFDKLKKEKTKLLEEIEKREAMYIEKLDIRDKEVEKLKETFQKARRIEDTKNTTLLKQNKILDKAVKGKLYFTLN